jgi:hypothetical protein
LASRLVDKFTNLTIDWRQLQKNWFIDNKFI